MKRTLLQTHMYHENSIQFVRFSQESPPGYIFQQYKQLKKIATHHKKTGTKHIAY